MLEVKHTPSGWDQGVRNNVSNVLGTKTLAFQALWTAVTIVVAEATVLMCGVRFRRANVLKSAPCNVG
jgi:hypothetical protein